MSGRVIKFSSSRVLSRRFSVFDTTNKIQGIRQKYYSNPAVGTTLNQKISIFKFYQLNNLSNIPRLYRVNYNSGAENPTYLKEPSDKVLFGIAVGGLTIGSLSILKGLYSMSFGINKVKK